VIYVHGSENEATVPDFNLKTGMVTSWQTSPCRRQLLRACQTLPSAGDEVFNDGIIPASLHQASSLRRSRVQILQHQQVFWLSVYGPSKYVSKYFFRLSKPEMVTEKFSMALHALTRIIDPDAICWSFLNFSRYPIF